VLFIEYVKHLIEAAFEALTDPTRRRIVSLLSERPRRAGELHDAFPISKPAVSRHLRVLRENGLIEELKVAGDGRVRLYRLRPEPLDEVKEWLDEVSRNWQSALESFKSYVEGGSST
jgi:DNA-binding transcriptional ArsR family regulator